MIDVGQIYPAKYLVVDGSGAPVNPTTMTLTITKPDQTLVSPAPTIANPPAVAGTFTYDYPIADEGLFAFTWASTAPVSSKTNYIHARRFRSAVSLEEARDYLNQQDTKRDELIRNLMFAATSEAEKIVGSIVPRTISAEFIGGTYKDVIQVLEGPLLNKTSITGLTSIWPGGPTWLLADLLVNPEAGTLRAADMLGFWWGPWEITSYVGGRSIVPEQIRLGILEILWDLWTPQRGATGDEAYPDLAEANAFEYQIPAGYHPPPRAMAQLEPYERPGFG